MLVSKDIIIKLFFLILVTVINYSKVIIKREIVYYFNTKLKWIKILKTILKSYLQQIITKSVVIFC